MIRPRGATTRRRDDQEQTGPSAQEIGQQLRSAREERGLDLLAVHDRLSRPITQIEALENGDLGRLGDRDVAASTLRRYATFLGLDAAALADQLGEAWPAGAPTGNGDATGVVDAHPNPTRAPSTDGDPEHLRAFTQTGEVPRFGVAPRSTTNGSGPDTGTFPVGPRNDLRASRRSVAKARRRLRAPTWLKVVTWVGLGCLLIVTAGWAIRTWSPQWLIQAHILRTTTDPGTPNSANPAAAAPPVSHQQAAVQVVGANPTGAAYVVSSPHFSVTLATTGRVWIRVISSASSVPLLQGVQPANQVFSYKANGTMTVTVGASPVVVGVSVKGKAPFLDKPSVAPFTYTFTPPTSH
ncbi:MAG: helix-turn-helix domain-containing protein [Acidimicrobiales bacterium]|nr:helix-turn-helix domain-containing protein [Acidimicrobiales bacterium]